MFSFLFFNRFSYTIIPHGTNTTTAASQILKQITLWLKSFKPKKFRQICLNHNKLATQYCSLCPGFIQSKNTQHICHICLFLVKPFGSYCSIAKYLQLLLNIVNLFVVNINPTTMSNFCYVHTYTLADIHMYIYTHNIHMHIAYTQHAYIT